MSATDGTRIAIETERTGHQVLVSMAQLLEESLAVQRHLLAAVSSGSRASGVPPEVGRSSCEVKTSTRGLDLTVKVYDGSDIGPVGSAALDAYFGLMADAQRRLNGSDGKS